MRLWTVLLLAVAACSPKPRIEWLPDTATPPAISNAAPKSGLSGGGARAARDGFAFEAEQSDVYGPVTVYRVRGDAREPILQETQATTDASIVIGTRHVWIMTTSSLESASDAKIYAALRESGPARLVTTSNLFSELGVQGDDAIFVTNEPSIFGTEHGCRWATRDEQPFELRRVSANGSRPQVLWTFDAAYGAIRDANERDILLFVERKSTRSYARLTLP